jgi:hypothetical protein
MHNFELETFMSLYDDKTNDIIEYIKNCSDKEIKINDITNKYYRYMYENNYDIYIELVKKKFEYNEYKIINYIITNDKYSADKIIPAVEIYKNNNWLEEDYNIIGKLLHINILRKEEDNNMLYDYAIKLYEYLNLNPEKYDILACNGERIDIYCIYKLLNYYKNKNYNIKKDIISYIRLNSRNYCLYDYYYSNSYHSNNPHIDIITKIIDFLIDNNLDVFTNKYNFPLGIAYFKNWDLLKKVLDIYVKNNIKFNCNIKNDNITILCENDLLYIISKYFPLEAVIYILDYCKENTQDIYKKTKTGFNFIDYIIESNTIDVLKYILSNNYIITNNKLEVYSPCHKCHNGEQHECNFHEIDTEFISMKRYGVKLCDLDKVTKDEYIMDYNYSYFCPDESCEECIKFREKY